MNLTVRISTFSYAMSIMAFGFLQIIFNRVIAGRPPAWPSWLPGELVFAYLSGVLFVVTGLLVVLNVKPVKALIGVAIVILFWSGLQNVYAVISRLDYGFSLTSAGKALTIGSGSLLVAVFFHNQENHSSQIVLWTSLCRYSTGFFLLVSGVQHFLFADFVKLLVPNWIPGPYFWTYLAGAALALTGFSLLMNSKAKLAATLGGWMIFTWLIILHIPRAIGNPTQNEWTAVVEALSVSSILHLLSQSLKRSSEG